MRQRSSDDEDELPTRTNDMENASISNDKKRSKSSKSPTHVPSSVSRPNAATTATVTPAPPPTQRSRPLPPPAQPIKCDDDIDINDVHDDSTIIPDDDDDDLRIIGDDDLQVIEQEMGMPMITSVTSLHPGTERYGELLENSAIL